MKQPESLRISQLNTIVLIWLRKEFNIGQDTEVMELLTVDSEVMFKWEPLACKSLNSRESQISSMILRLASSNKPRLNSNQQLSLLDSMLKAQEEWLWRMRLESSRSSFPCSSTSIPPQSTQSTADYMIWSFISFTEDRITLSYQYLVFFSTERRVEIQIMSF